MHTLSLQHVIILFVTNFLLNYKNKEQFTILFLSMRHNKKVKACLFYYNNKYHKYNQLKNTMIDGVINKQEYENILIEIKNSILEVGQLLLNMMDRKYVDTEKYYHFSKTVQAKIPTLYHLIKNNSFEMDELEKYYFLDETNETMFNSLQQLMQQSMQYFGI